jgi:hypothetical protein
VDFLSGVADAAFVAEVRPNAPPASDILFASLPIPLVFFSSPEAPDLAPSSFDTKDGRDLCALAIVGVLEAGFPVAVLVGRTGGLLSVLPAVDRAVVVLVGFMNDEVFEDVDFVPVNGRFGGMLALVEG